MKQTAKAKRKKQTETEQSPVAVPWTIVFTLRARIALNNIQDIRIKEAIRERIEGLSKDPEKQGKPMVNELKGYYSLRAIGQRYRIIYKVQRDQIIVHVVNVGIRKEGDKTDVYELTRKLLRLGLLEPPQN